MKGFMKSSFVRTLAGRTRIAQVVAVASFAALFTTACERKAPITGPGALFSITVTPNPQTLSVNATQQFTAVGKDANGAVVAFTPVWTVASSGGAINASTGMFTAGSTMGTFANTITATSGGVSGNATVIVTAGPLATITITPNPATLVVGGAQTFTAVGKDAGGNVVTIAPAWSVVANGGLINASTGAFTAGATAGTFANTVKATSGTVSATATVIVTAGPLANITVTPNPVTLDAGMVQQFTAVGTDAGGNVIAITPAWSVVNSSAGSIHAVTGAFTAGSTAGTFANTVKATSGTISGTATVTVNVPAPPTPTLTSITVEPNPATVNANASQQFTAVGRDQFGAVFAITPVWSLTNGGGSINATTGVFKAANVLVPGTFVNTVTATAGGRSGSATVTVIPNPPVLTTITVTPNPITVASGGTQQFTAVGRDQNGNVFAITPAWDVQFGGGAINGTGLFTAGSFATTTTFANTVRARSGTVAGTATVTVLAAPPAPDFVDLGAAGPMGIMAGTAVSCATDGTINAGVAISPGSTISGPCVIPPGGLHLNDLTAQNAQIDLTAAYNFLAGQPCGTVVGTGNMGFTTKQAGVYCSGSSMLITGPLTLDGQNLPNQVFIFQAGSSLTTAGDILLINGAEARNVYFVLGTAGSGSATFGSASHMLGNFLTLDSISFLAGSTLTGRALARNGAVSLTTGTTINLP